MSESKKIEQLEVKIEDYEKKVSSLLVEIETYKVSLEESERLHDTIVNNSLDGTLILDEDCIITYANTEIYNFLGFKEENFINKNFLDFITDPYKDEFNNISKKILKNVLGIQRFEIDVLDHNNKVINLLGTGSISKDGSNHNIILQLLDISDIKAAELRQKQINIELEEKVDQRTAQLQSTMQDLESEIKIRKAAEVELLKAKEEAQKAFEKEKELNSLKTRFISMISHEYRTPLTVILTSSYLIEQFYQGDREEDFKKFLSKIRTSVNGMTQLLEDVLAIGKSESERSKIFVEEFDIIDFVNDILDEIRVVDKSKHKFELSYSILHANLYSDKRALKHIIQNLMTNACKYSPDADKVDISISEEDEKVIIAVQDYGIGIPKEDQKQLFETFHRASNVGAIQGTGLGLSIVKKSVDSIKGKIELESEPGEGSKFILTLPKKLKTPFS